MPEKIIFLDRDGVINRRIYGGYVTKWEDFQFIPGVVEALHVLAELGYAVIVITNQQCIGKKLMSVTELAMIHEKMTLELEKAGVNVLDIFVCPHLDSDNCDCRKPKPGLLFQAKEKYDLNLNRTYFIGDSITDIEAGKSAGTKTILISDNFFGMEKRPEPVPDKIFPDVNQAVSFLLQELK